ncbi:MAG: histidine phosphatase family protein [Myxococcales bacterium]|nr:histidine phosphatase family protein [Myxococcales bacterium]MCB9751585.1 histidine phosphatase family protein [Myxococcales bacterium]
MPALPHNPPAVLLVRHGESASNAGLVTDEPAEIPLTRRGHAQARRFAELLGRPPARVLSSTFTRAVETARPVRARHELPDEFLPVHEFTYLAPARCRGTDRRARAPWVADYWRRCDPRYRDGPGAESFAAFTRRVLAFRDALARGEHRGDVVFSHGLFMKALLWIGGRELAPDDPAEMASFREFSSQHWIPNLGLLRVETGRDTRDVRVALDLELVPRLG